MDSIPIDPINRQALFVATSTTGIRLHRQVPKMVTDDPLCLLIGYRKELCNIR